MPIRVYLMRIIARVATKTESFAPEGLKPAVHRTVFIQIDNTWKKAIFDSN
jgi:hypothetical protein